jgi:hypothetical protein
MELVRSSETLVNFYQIWCSIRGDSIIRSHHRKNFKSNTPKPKSASKFSGLPTWKYGYPLWNILLATLAIVIIALLIYLRTTFILVSRPTCPSATLNYPVATSKFRVSTVSLIFNKPLIFHTEYISVRVCLWSITIQNVTCLYLGSWVTITKGNVGFERTQYYTQRIKVVMSCSSETAQHFGGTYYPHLQGVRLSQARNTLAVKLPARKFAWKLVGRKCAEVGLRTGANEERAMFMHTFL